MNPKLLEPKNRKTKITELETNREQNLHGYTIV